MPYQNERASRLGHVPTVNNSKVKAVLAGLTVAHASPTSAASIISLCTPVDALPGQRGDSEAVTRAITVDGSNTEVDAHRQYPTVKVGYLRVAGSLVNLEEFKALGHESLIDPRRVREAHKQYSFDAALPGTGLVRSGMSGRDTWRTEMNAFFSSTQIDSASPMTLTDGLMAVHGTCGKPAPDLDLRVCPCCAYKPGGGDPPLRVAAGSTCSNCGSALFPVDTLRMHEEFNPEGSNLMLLTRAMNVAERLMIACYVDILAASPDPDLLSQTLFVTDGPLALFGTAAPQSRAFLSYYQSCAKFLRSQAVEGPLMVGIEKSGAFVEHATEIAEHVPVGTVMSLPNDYVNRITGRPPENMYGTDEFYGRRFFYRTTIGDMLVVTVPPKPGVAPYGPAAASEDLASYPYLQLVCKVLDSLRTRMYQNATIPVALAHSAASLPLGIGHSVLTALAQENIPGLRRDFRPTARPTY